MQKERMHDVLLLLAHLVKSEEATVKLILDALYDVASVNLINKKLQSRSLNAIAKSIARMSKPVFRIFALRWVQKNCPQLITNWLYLQVSFTVLQTTPAPAVTVPEVPLNSLPPIENTSREEIKRLRSEVRYLAGIAMGALAALASTLVWVNRSPQARAIYSCNTSSTGICVPANADSFDDRTR
ncbi:hypothetical protein NUACC21_50150 [Scytonema sp. NUACC21]